MSLETKNAKRRRVERGARRTVGRRRRRNSSVSLLVFAAGFRRIGSFQQRCRVSILIKSSLPVPGGSAALSRNFTKRAHVRSGRSCSNIQNGRLVARRLRYLADDGASARLLRLPFQSRLRKGEKPPERCCIAHGYTASLISCFSFRHLSSLACYFSCRCRKLVPLSLDNAYVVSYFRSSSPPSVHRRRSFLSNFPPVELSVLHLTYLEHRIRFWEISSAITHSRLVTGNQPFSYR